MEFCIDQLSESPSKNSLTGSYYKILAIPRETVLSPKDAEPLINGPGLQPTKQNSQALVDALRTLQKRLEAEKNYPQFSHDAKTHEPVAMATSLPVTEGDNRSGNYMLRSPNAARSI